MLLQTWSDVFVQSLQNVWLGVANILPNLLIAVIIFSIGWLVGNVLEKVIEQLFKTLKVDSALRQAGVDDVTSKAGVSLNSGLFVGALIRWFVIIVFLVASFDVLGLSQVNDFLKNVVLGYLPNVIVSVLILLVAAVIADAMQKVVSASAKAANVRKANLLGNVAKWSIWAFAILAALFQLGIAAAFVQTIFTGIIIALSLAIGLAFGLGGQESAAHILESVRHEISEK
ncbi:MAG: hypothetical protein WCW87_04260 [Candidatus Paceibacterota bacterium]